MNKLLLRQVQKYLIDKEEFSPELNKVLSVISESYDHYEKDRKMLEHSIELSSNELVELNNKLKKESEKLIEAQSIANLGSWEWDVINDKLYWSDELYRIFEIDKNAFKATYQDYFSFIHPDDKAYANSSVLKCFKDHLPFSFESRIITGKGVLKILYAQGKVSLNDKGEVIKLTGIGQDITDRKQSELALQNAHRQMQTLFENIEEVFFSVDMVNYQVLQMSFACEKVYGRQRQDFFERPNLWYEIVLEEDKKIIDENNTAMNAGKSFSQEYRIQYNENTIRWLETKITPTLNKEGKLIRIDGVTSDISKRREAEEIMKANNDELKKTNSELDKFVYSVSHDLRAPLTSVLGIIDLTEMKTQEELTKKHLHLIKKSVTKLDGFISDILDYSRNARVEIRKDEIHFDEILEEITDNLKYMNGADSKVDLQIKINNGVQFKSDRSRLNIILNNLISNAIRYHNPKLENPYVNITVDVSSDEVLIAINDNGIGISKEFHQKVFEMFYRVSENSVGSGLGLYIVKETVEKLKGKITVESEVGKGTSFNISIPNNI